MSEAKNVSYYNDDGSYSPVGKNIRDHALEEAAQVAMEVGDKAYHDRLFAASAKNRYAQEQIIRQDTADAIAKAIQALKEKR
jgi:hypothetical protein